MVWAQVVRLESGPKVVTFLGHLGGAKSGQELSGPRVVWTKSRLGGLSGPKVVGSKVLK